MAIAPGTISIGTNCDHKVVPVEIKITNSEPRTDLREWDHLVQCGINVSTGSVVVSGWFNSWEEAARIDIPQGSYIARVSSGNQYFCNGVSKCSEYYSVAIWPGRCWGVHVLKQRTDLPWRHVR